MAVEFQEYKGKRKPINPQHKFPLLRLLFVALAAFMVYCSGVLNRLVDALPLPGNDSTPVEDTWETRCEAMSGTAFGISDSIAQCSWALTEELRDSIILPSQFMRYVASLQDEWHSKIHWIAKKNDFSNPLVVLHETGNSDYYYHIMKDDSSYVWIRMDGVNDGCRFPGACPHMPLEWSALAISEGFDFEGQDALLAMDVFRGLGETPIQAVLPGRVVDLGKDSLGYFVEIDHGNNIMSKTSGMGIRNENLSVGDVVAKDDPIGRLAPLDSSAFYLTIRENGRFVRWKDFYKDAYPIPDERIRAFQKSVSALFGSK